MRTSNLNTSREAEFQTGLSCLSKVFQLLGWAMRTSPPVVNFSFSRGVRSALLLVNPSLIMLPIHCTHVASRGGSMWVVLPHGGFCDALCMS